MALHGDLSTLDLADLLQSLAQHGRTGTLTVAPSSEGPGDAPRSAASRPSQGEADPGRHLYFREGKLTLFGAAGRPKLMEVLVACGRISNEQLRAARAERKGTRRSLGETLVNAGDLAGEDLERVATSRLLDDACELIGSGHGAFRFEEGPVPRGLFDPEERRLGMELAPGALLLEAARRSDHWEMIRSRIPSGAGHYVVRRAPRPGAVEGDAELLAELLERLDGNRSIEEVLARFPHRRFDAYQILANLCDARAIRLASADDMARLARAALPHEPELADRLVQRGLEVQPDHVGLLDTLVELAESRGDAESAADALKLLAHMRMAAKDGEGARAVLERAKQVVPEDRSIWQKSWDLALDEGRVEDALADGHRLADLLHAAGLHRRTSEVLERMVALDPDGWEFRSRLAHCRSDCGELERATEELCAFGRSMLAEARYDDARQVFVEVRQLDPNHGEARRTLEGIDSGELERRRERQSRFARAFLLGGLTLLLGAWLGYEVLARGAYRDALRSIHEDGLFERRDYPEASRRLVDVRAAFPLSSTALWDVSEDLRLFEARTNHDAHGTSHGTSDGSAPLAPHESAAEETGFPPPQDPDAVPSPAPGTHLE